MLKIGEFSALITAVCWTICAIAFESASKKTSALAVNFLRLFIAFLVIGLILVFKSSHFIPYQLSSNAWIYLSISGIIGFVLGDQLLIKSFTMIGSKLAIIIMTLVPPTTAVLGFIFLDEVLSLVKVLGITITICGILVVILNKKSNFMLNTNKKYLGYFYAFIGAISQATGIILSKFGLEGIDAISATQIRLSAGLLVFIPILLISKNYKLIIEAVKNRVAFNHILIGTVVGPIIGVVLSLVSIQYTKTGIAATLMAVSPILMIPATVIAFKQKTNYIEIIGALVGLAGIAILFN